MELEELIRKSAPRWSIPVSLLRVGARDPTLRAGLLKLVDVLPSLAMDKELKRHFLMYIAPYRAKLPLNMRLASYSFNVPVFDKIAAKATRWAIREKLAPYFIVSDEKSLEKVRENYARDGTGLVLDFLGELVVSQSEADYFLDRYIQAMRGRGRERIAIKFSSLFPYFGPYNYGASVREVSERFSEILRIARDTGSNVTVDAEHYDYRGLTEDIFCEVALRREFRDFPDMGIALQAYLVDSMESAERLVGAARERGMPFNIRLVKGAYWDSEIALARQRSWPVPVFEQKHQTDANFNKLVYFLFQNWQYAHVSPATHNPFNISFACEIARDRGVLDDPAFEFQVLYGLGEPVRRALCKKGLPVRAYVPVGDLTTGMSYFARRILENTANEGFLLQLIS